MKKKYIIISLVILSLFLIGFFIIKNQFNLCFHTNFIKNASDGMKFKLGRCDILLRGRGIYSKTNENNESITIALCEECGTENNCLDNNLKMLNQLNTISDEDVMDRYGEEGVDIINSNKLIREYNLSLIDLKGFYVYPLTYDKLNSLRMSNETIYDVYDKYKGSCYL